MQSSSSAHNFGEVFQPARTVGLCRRFRTVPKGKDYLAVEVSILRKLYSEHGSLKDQRQITATGTRWHRSNHLFESCPRGKARGKGLCKCERIQEFVQKIALACQAPGTAWAFWYCDLRSRDLSLGERTHQIFVKRPRHSSKARYRSTFSSGNPVTRPKSKRRELWDALKDWDPEGEPLRHSTLYQFDNMPLDRAIKSNSADTRLEMFDTKSTIPNPSVRRSGYPSFYSTESTSLSTGRTSSTAATDLEYKTPATSEHTRSDREHAAYFSSLIDPVIQSNGISEEPLGIGKRPPAAPQHTEPQPSAQHRILPLLYSDVTKLQPTIPASPGDGGASWPVTNPCMEHSIGPYSLPSASETKREAYFQKRVDPQAREIHVQRAQIGSFPRNPSSLDSVAPKTGSKSISNTPQRPILRRRRGFKHQNMLDFRSSRNAA